MIAERPSELIKMKKQVLFIHSGGTQDPHQGSSDLVAYLRYWLGRTHHIMYPMMPDPDNPRYDRWKSMLREEVAQMDDPMILVGHSLGGSVLLKYLTEEPCDKSVAGLFLVASPYWGKKNWNVEEYVLRDTFYTRLSQVSKTFLYHSRDDEVVPYEHLGYYARKIPNATSRRLSSRGHLFSKGLPELVEDIKTPTMWGDGKPGYEEPGNED